MLLLLTNGLGKMPASMLAKVERETPKATLVVDGQQMKLAQADASQVNGECFYGIGHSMEPLYPPKTAIVTKPVAYDDIKKGMTVVYRKSNGKVVAHAVIDEDRNGYIVQGVNNDEEDSESVNEKNLIGVVVKAYSAKV